ncbi:MAG: glutathione synthase [Arenicellales bacterium]
MRHAFIMDPLDRVKAHKDTTYFLMLAARARGHEVFYIDPGALVLRHNAVFAMASRVEVLADMKRPFEVKETQTLALESMDAVWIRQDPPFDRRYLYVTLILDYLPSQVQVINRPSTIRDWNEKLAALRYPELTPRTLVSRSQAEIEAFLQDQDRITVKPVDGHGGKGIIFLEKNTPQEQLKQQLYEATHQEQHWVIAQEYLPAAREGDKRILLLDGQPLGAILRVHAEGVELNNLDQGGSAQPSELTERDKQICALMQQDLVDHGVRFAGIDVIGGMLIEVNITSPTGLQEMSRFDRRDHHLRIIETLEG